MVVHQKLKLEIAKGKVSDIPTILRIQKECKLSEWSSGDYLLEMSRTDSIILIAQITEVTTLEKMIAGFLIGRQVLTEEFDLLNFGVFRRFQKKGIGNMLWKELHSYLQKMSITSIWLEVRETNQSARKFYQKRGFVDIQTRKNFYNNPLENARVMKLDLSLKKSEKLD